MNANSDASGKTYLQQFFKVVCILYMIKYGIPVWMCLILGN